MKKFFCMALIMSVSISAFSQRITNDSIEKVVNEKHENLLKKIDFQKSSKPDFGEAKTQFLLENSKVAKFSKTADIKDVYNNIKSMKNSISIDFKHKNLEKPIYDGLGKIKKGGTIQEKNKYLQYHTKSEIHTRVQGENVYSNAKYNVTFNWRVHVSRNKKDSITKISKNANLISIETQPIDYTIAEKATMTEIAEKAIAEWYKTLPENLEKKGYVSSLPIEQEMKKGILNGQTYTAQNDVTIYIPHEYKDIEDGPWLYDEEEPMDNYNLNIKFTIKFNDDLNTVDSSGVVVEYDQGDINSAMTSEEKMRRRDSMKTFATKFVDNLKTYVENPSEEIKSELASMFVNKDDKVIEVSRRFKKNIEVNTRTVEKYLTKLAKLKPVNMEIKLAEPTYSNNSTEAVIYPFYQIFKSQTYSDETNKELYLKYVNGTCVIEKINVVKEQY